MLLAIMTVVGLYDPFPDYDGEARVDDSWDEQIEGVALSGKLDSHNDQAIEEIRHTGYSHMEGTELIEGVLTTSTPDQDAPVVFITTQPSPTITSGEKPRRGRPKLKDTPSNAERLREWRAANPDKVKALQKKHQAAYRKRKSGKGYAK